MGLLVALLSLFIGLGGFGVTLWQLRKVKNVTIAQQSAISSLKMRLAQIDVIQECAKAENALADVRSALLSDSGDISLACLDLFAVSLVTLLEGSPFLNEETRGRLKSAISEIDRMSEASQRKRPSKIDAAKRAITLREYHGLLVKVRSQVQQEQLV